MTETTTDYDFPLDWEEMTSAEKCTWMIKERNRRQAARQGTVRDNKGGWN